MVEPTGHRYLGKVSGDKMNIGNRVHNLLNPHDALGSVIACPDGIAYREVFKMREN